MQTMTTYARNKKATFNYEILERFEAGVVLRGYEVKAIRSGKASLVAAYIVLREGQAYLKGASVTYYQEANTPDSYNPERERKLLLNKKELLEIEKQLNTAGLTVVPISWYSKDSKIKLEIALVRGKKKVDKRETLKKRDNKRAIDRILKTER
jgi:SsrA-binding protein